MSGSTASSPSSRSHVHMRFCMFSRCFSTTSNGISRTFRTSWKLVDDSFSVTRVRRRRRKAWRVSCTIPLGGVNADLEQIELMRRKQGTSHLDARHQLMLENAFYQVRLSLNFELEYHEVVYVRSELTLGPVQPAGTRRSRSGRDPTDARFHPAPPSRRTHEAYT
jgi:hypothetical protein